MKMVKKNQLILARKLKNDIKVEVSLSINSIFKMYKNVLLKIKNDYYILSYHYHKEYV